MCVPRTIWFWLELFNEENKRAQVEPHSHKWLFSFVPLTGDEWWSGKIIVSNRDKCNESTVQTGANMVLVTQLCMFQKGWNDFNIILFPPERMEICMSGGWYACQKDSMNAKQAGKSWCGKIAISKVTQVLLSATSLLCFSGLISWESYDRDAINIPFAMIIYIQVHTQESQCKVPQLPLSPTYLSKHSESAYELNP